MNEPAPRAKDIFLAAIEIGPPGQRAAHLDAACAGDVDLRRRVDALLAAHERPESLLDRAAVAAVDPTTPPPPSPDASPAEGPGARAWHDLWLELLGEGGMGTAFLAAQDRLDRVAGPRREVATPQGTDEAARAHAPTISLDGESPIVLRPEDAQAITWPADEAGATATGTKVRSFGDYELLEEIARGGMGVVYKARQIRLHRPVALKMILAGRLATGDDIKRFRNEAEAVADLDQPNIVPIYEVGEHAGASYFAMKLIEGGSLAGRLSDYAADPKAAARLVATVARAIHHAHQRGILHRDLKPSNILLDARGEPYVTDFGLAKRVGADAELTQSGALLGSPSYMAAEQASGAKGTVTMATDVYGLGAVLYALLTGRPPFLADSVLETLELVRTRAPEPSSGLNHRVDRDLQTICLKCLDKDPLRRYASALGLAEDLERWLRGEPIAARPVGRMERAWRWCRRNPIVAGLGGVVIVLVAAGLVGLAVANRGLSVAHHATQRTLGREKQQKGQAEANLRIALAREAEADAQRRRAEANFARALDAVRQMTALPSERQDLMDLPQIGEIRKTLLDRALVFYQGVLDSRGMTPEERLERGWVYLRMAEVYNQYAHLGNYAGLNLEERRRMHDRAKEATARALDLLERLAADFPAEPRYRLELARAWLFASWDLAKPSNNMPTPGERVEERVEIEAKIRKALDLLERLAADFPAKPTYRTELASGYGFMAMSLRSTNRLARPREAEPWLRKALTLQEGLLEGVPASVENRQAYASLLESLAMTTQSDRHQESETLFRRCISIREGLLDQAPGEILDLNMLVQGYRGLAGLLSQSGRHREGEEVYRRSIARVEGWKGTPPIREPRSRSIILTEDYRGLYECLMRAGRLKDAEAALRASLAHREEWSVSFYYLAEVASGYEDLGALRAGLGWRSEARDAYGRAADLWGRLVAEVPKIRPDDPVARYGARRGDLLLTLGHHREAEEVYRTALAAARREAEARPGEPQRSRLAVITGLLRLAVLLDGTDRAELARDFDLQADAELARVFDLQAAKDLDRLQRLLRQNGEGPLAEAAVRREMAVLRRVAASDPKDLVQCRRKAVALNDLAWLLATRFEPRDPARALALAREATELVPREGGFWNTLGVAHYRAGDWNAAIEALEKSMALGSGGVAADWLFLAMAHWRRGDKDEARRWYDKAIQWMDSHQPTNEELGRFRAEAEALMGLRVQPTPVIDDNYFPRPVIIRIPGP